MTIEVTIDEFGIAQAVEAGVPEFVQWCEFPACANIAEGIAWWSNVLGPLHLEQSGTAPWT